MKASIIAVLLLASATPLQIEASLAKEPSAEDRTATLASFLLVGVTLRTRDSMNS